jgi:hypothetical protein
VLIHDLMLAGSITVPPRPVLAPACSDAEPLAIAEVRHLPAQNARIEVRPPSKVMSRALASRSM